MQVLTEDQLQAFEKGCADFLPTIKANNPDAVWTRAMRKPYYTATLNTLETLGFAVSPAWAARVMGG